MGLIDQLRWERLELGLMSFATLPLPFRLALLWRPGCRS